MDSQLPIGPILGVSEYNCVTATIHIAKEHEFRRINFNRSFLWELGRS